ncbi:hypothetical protein FACS1894110_01930 [Spirochaetia bacterium]|nr:hypothetical protein FACS1894110_01930 [Spirochaetia bacterium]
MKEKYHGIISGGCMGIVYENWYDDKRKAEKEVRLKAKELIRNSCDEYMSAYYMVSLSGEIVASGDIPMRGLRHIWKNYPGNGWHDYGYMVIGGVRIC